MRYTYGGRSRYWIAGSLIVGLLMPALSLDIAFAPRLWTAPNWQCDAIFIGMIRPLILFPPWAITTSLLIAAFVFLIVRRRKAGADILDIRLGKSPWKWLVNLVTLAILYFILYDVAMHFWQALIPQDIYSDCAGRAEMVVMTMRGPIVQATPLVEFAFGFWLLHIRALLLSPLEPPPPPRRAGPTLHAS